MVEVKENQFKEVSEDHYLLEIPLVSCSAFEIELYGFKLNSRLVNKICKCLNWIVANESAAAKMANDLLDRIQKFRDEYYYHQEGIKRLLLDFRCIGIYLDKEFVFNDKVNLVYEQLEGGQEEVLGKRHIVYRLMGDKLFLIGAEWNY